LLPFCRGGLGALFGSYVQIAFIRRARRLLISFSAAFVLLAVDRMNLKPRYFEATVFSLPMFSPIGVCQCLAMVPGVSRSGATIVGAMLFGADRRSAAEFSFWLAMPTMVGAFAYEAFKSPARIDQPECDRIAGRIYFLVYFRLDRGEDVSALRAASLIRAVCLVAHHRRQHRRLRDLFF